MYLKCDIMNNAGIVDRVDCACKLNCVPPETQISLHALLGDHLCVDSDECCVPIVDTVISDNTLLGNVKIPLKPTTSTSFNDPDFGIVSIKQSSTESNNKTNKSSTCGFLRKKISDKHGTNKSIFPVSYCICKTHKWKFPMIMQKAWKHNRRVRLKSYPSVNMPLQRYQSHHSSSDEDWFEEIADDEVDNCNEKKNKYNNTEGKIPSNTDNNSANFDHESSDHVVTNRFKLCSFIYRKFCDKPQLTETKIIRRNPNNSCKII